jgi:hypothetical protein
LVKEYQILKQVLFVDIKNVGMIYTPTLHH